MKKRSNSGAQPLTVIGPGHQIPPKNRFGIFAVHSYPPDGPPMTKDGFNALLQVVEEAESALQTELQKIVVETSPGEFTEVG